MQKLKSPSSGLLRCPEAVIFEIVGKPSRGPNFWTIFFLPNRIYATRLGSLRNCARKRAHSWGYAGRVVGSRSDRAGRGREPPKRRCGCCDLELSTGSAGQL
jgi:hypothetical protein